MAMGISAKIADARDSYQAEPAEAVCLNPEARNAADKA
jgi:hypothetical protein